MISTMPCPFCGSTYVAKVPDSGGAGFRLRCVACDAQTGVGRTDAVLKTYWERRPRCEPAEALVERHRVALQEMKDRPASFDRLIDLVTQQYAEMLELARRGGDDTTRYLREQHRAVMKRIELYTTPGHGAPGFVADLQQDARALEAALLIMEKKT